MTRKNIFLDLNLLFECKKFHQLPEKTKTKKFESVVLFASSHFIYKNSVEQFKHLQRKHFYFQ